MTRCLLLAAAWACAPAAALAAREPAYTIAYQCSLELRDKPPTFATLYGPQVLDRGRMVQLGRPIERPDVLTLLDLKTFTTTEVAVPGLRGAWPSDKVPEVDRPMFYDTGTGEAGIVLRTGGVRGPAEYARWDLKAGKITHRFPLADPDGAQWMSVTPVGYDPVRREGYIEIVKYGARFRTAPNASDQYDVAVVAVTDRARTVAAWRTSQKLGTKGPYFDPVHRRSMHIEYAEFAGTISNAWLVDLDAGTVKSFPLPPLIYGFAFDPDPRKAWAYSYRTRAVFPLDLETGAMGKSRVFGNVGHLLDFVGPGLLCLGRDVGMHFLETPSLRERFFLDPKNLSQAGEGAHLEGSIFLPGRALIRSYGHFYVIDFPGFAGRVPAGR